MYKFTVKYLFLKYIRRESLRNISKSLLCVLTINKLCRNVRNNYLKKDKYKIYLKAKNNRKYVVLNSVLKTKIIIFIFKKYSNIQLVCAACTLFYHNLKQDFSPYLSTEVYYSFFC